ncbi:MAG: MarR family winged helix-turn-helix transcriptional regulator [Gemmatimonadales bacterium]
MKALTESVLETSLLVARLIRTEARRSRPAGLSLSEFRALGYLSGYPDSTLTDLADYLGLQLPTASKVVDTLFKSGDLTRREDAVDRRRSRLALTEAGTTRVAIAMETVRTHLGQRLAGMSAADQRVVTRAMEILGPLVGPTPQSDAPHAVVHPSTRSPAPYAR